MPNVAKAATLLYQALRYPSEGKMLVHYAVWRDPLHNFQEHPETSGWDRETMKTCWGFLDLTSRSFAAVIKELEGELCRVVAIFYLVLRALDTVEDDMTLPLDVKAPLLEDFYNKLEIPGWNFQDSGPNEADAPVLKGFQDVITEFQMLDKSYQIAISDITKKMGHGMARYCRLHAESNGKFSVDTLASFDLYCHFVAGLVGEGLSRLFSASGKESKELGEQLGLSNSMGLMLQKTNILRDFREDADEGRVFWPEEIWGKYVTKVEELYQKGNEDKAMWALSEMTVDALTHATDALDYLTLLRNQSVFNFCAIPQVMAVATLDLCFMNPAVMQRNIKIRKGKAVQLICEATNPRDVAYIFRDYLRSIHAKARANDPSFIKIAVLAGRVEQWTESRYPSFISIGQPAPQSSDDWVEGMDARIKQLPKAYVDPEAVARKERAKRMMENNKMSYEDYKFMALMLLGVVGIIGLMCAIGGVGIWWFFIREGAWFAEIDGPVEAAKATISAVVGKDEL
ncbi:farnesyl-diphosphate farnesyltransferase [Pseudohyphozyma bogoriensis]|nr:farnesyl-diphosphate farnesyltransferase [Pseudohyphozyma bogoriensis]